MPVVASPTRWRRGLDAVRALQRTLYRAAKADPGRRFHALYDKVHRRDVLERAWGQVRRNAAHRASTRTTFADVEQYGVDRLLDELAGDCGSGGSRRSRPGGCTSPSRARTERRPLSIPAIRDRVVQAAVKIVLEPIFEADMLACSFGFRPRRAAHDALQVVVDESFGRGGGGWWRRTSPTASRRSRIDGLMSAVSERICDRKVLALLRAFLRAGVMEDGAVRRPVSGTPQGGVISPLLCNVYLNRLDRAWRAAYGALVRYADDLLVVCRSRGQAEAALAKLTTLLQASACSRSRRRRGSCNSSRASRGSTSSASTIGSCAHDHAAGPAGWFTWPAGPPATGGAARPGPHPVPDDAGPAGRAGRTSRGGSQPLPARLGRVLPFRQLGLGVRQDQQVRPHAGRAVCRQAAPARPSLVHPPLDEGWHGLRRTGSVRAGVTASVGRPSRARMTPPPPVLPRACDRQQRDAPQSASQ